jgi:translation initiation factor 2 subunit 1
MSDEYPHTGEIVLGKVKFVNPFSAIIVLDEYGLEGMVHISEVTNKWVKDIRTHVKPGQNVVAKVMRIDARRGHINLSLKRVRPREKEEKIKSIKRKQKAKKMIKMVGKNLKMDNKAITDLEEKIKEEFGEVFSVFEHSMTDKGKELLDKKGFDKKTVDAILEIAEKIITIKEVDVKVSIDMKCYAGDGIEKIKKAVEKIDKEISIKYISAPRYILSIVSKDAKRADKKIKASVEALNNELKSDGEVVIVE